MSATDRRCSSRLGPWAGSMRGAASPFAAPSTIVGVGLIGLWNRPGVVGALYGTDVMFILGYLARFVPVAALAIAATTP